MSLWLRSEHWPEGHYELTLDAHADRSPLRCSFDVAYGDALAEVTPASADAGTTDSLGTRSGTCVRSNGHPLVDDEINLSVGREVEISMHTGAETVGLQVVRSGESVCEREIVPEYVEYAPVTQCSSGCKHADVELDLQL